MLIMPISKTVKKLSLDRWLQLKLFVGLLVFTHTINAADIFETVTDSMLTTPAADDWLSYRGNLAGWGYSSLKQIDKNNVNSLGLAWSFHMEPGTNEATPLVHNGVLYLGQSGNVIQAIDGRNGNLLWEYRRLLPPDTLNNTRSIAIYGDKLFIATHDAHLIALDARNGDLIWETKVGDYQQINTSVGPLVANGKVFTGRSCALPEGCFIAAHDASTGKELWRRYVIPREGEPGDETWGELPFEKRKHVGAWGGGAYDAELNLLYWGTSNPAPSPEFMRGTIKQDALYSNSTLALNADTGDVVWHFQHLPRPNWDFDHTFERILIDGPVRPDKNATWEQNPSIELGEPRQLMTGIPGKTGLVWTLDRATGEFLWARETVRQNVIKSIDPLTGKVTVNEAAIPDDANAGYGLICPSYYGARNWMTGAYSPESGAMYMPLLNTCMLPEIKSSTKTTVSAKTIDYGFIPNPFVAPKVKTLSQLEAISVETGKTLWKFEQQAAMYSVVATAGNLVFAGDSNRRFRAFNANTGEVIWETILNGPVSGHPISYAVDGTQYIAVTAGGGDRLSGVLNSLVGLSPPRGVNMLYVFSLPQKVISGDSVGLNHSKPSLNTTEHGELIAPEFTRVQVERGEVAYMNYCARCHNSELTGGTAPAITGAGFFNRWSGKNGQQLFDRIWSTMPLDAPRSLERNKIVDIMAFWYSKHGYSANADKPLEDGLRLKKLRLNPP